MSQRFRVLVMGVCGALWACEGDTEYDDAGDPVARSLQQIPVAEPTQEPTFPIPPGYNLACLDSQYRVEVTADTIEMAQRRLDDAIDDYCASIGCTAGDCSIAAVNVLLPNPNDQRYHFSACVNTECSEGGGDDDDDGDDEAYSCDDDPTTCGPGEGPWCEECLAIYCVGRCGWTYFDEFEDENGAFGAECPDTCAQDLGPGYSCGDTGHCVLDTSQLPSGSDCHDACSGGCGIYTCTENGHTVTQVCGTCAQMDGHDGECGVEGSPTVGDIHASCFYAYAEEPPVN
jgi:hypothetical protein